MTMQRVAAHWRAARPAAAPAEARPDAAAIYAPEPADSVTLVVAASGAILTHTPDAGALLQRLPPGIVGHDPVAGTAWRVGARVLQLEHRAHIKGQSDGPDLCFDAPLGGALIRVAVRLFDGRGRGDGEADRPAFLVTVARHERVEVSAASKLMAAGVSRTQSLVGGELVAGRSKSEIAARAGVKVSSVEDATRKLYQKLDLHSAQELAAWTWGVRAG